MMKKILNIKRIFIIGIISLVSIGIMLSSNWNYFIRNNANNNTALNSYQISSKNSFNDNYNEEVHSIVFQINVLKQAIGENNILFHKYNNIFKHNINYIRIQKSKIKNKIKIANSSITHELDILDNMKLIISAHPYNYLKFFQHKNYTLPEIISQKETRNYYNSDNIKINNQNIKQSDVSIKNISYQSEEALLGINSMSSIATSSKTLLFSKNSFDYSNIYYFSNKSNNLSTMNKAVQISTSNSKGTNAANTNIFLSKTKKHRRSPYGNFREFSKTISKYWNNYKGSIITGSVVFFFGEVGIGIGGYMLAKKIKSKIVMMKKRSSDKRLAESTSHNVQGGASVLSNNETSNYQGISSDESVDDTESIASIDLHHNDQGEFIATTANQLYENDGTQSTFNDGTEEIIQFLYNNIQNKKSVSYESFRSQLIDYAKIKKQEAKGVFNSNEMNTYNIKALAGVNTNSPYIEKANLRHEENVSMIRKITYFDENRDTPEVIAGETTSNGWFNLPSLQLLDKESLTEDEMVFIGKQINSFISILTSIPKTEALGEDANIHEIINSQIFQDFKELVKTYQKHLETVYTPVVRTGGEKIKPIDISSTDIKINNFLEQLKQARLAKGKAADMGHFGIKDEELFEHIDNLARLLHTD